MASEQDVIRAQTSLRGERFDLTGRAATMKAVVTTGNGGLDMLEYRDVPVPEPGQEKSCCGSSPPASTTPRSTRAWAGTPPA